MIISRLKDIPHRGKPIPGTPYRVGDPIGDRWLILHGPRNGLIGQGGMGLVYLIYDWHSASKYALKTFRGEFLTYPAVKKAFSREIELWVGLDRHPHILEVVGIEEVSYRLYVQMEYIPSSPGMLGSSLRDHLQRGSIPEQQIFKWAIQVCHAMEHAKKHGMTCHRDIKPENILVDQEGNIRISDFGLARALDSVRPDSIKAEPTMGDTYLTIGCGGGCGTPAYMPPEQFTSGGGDIRNDIYSFGIVLHEMVTGKLPYIAHLPSSRNLEDRTRYMRVWEQLHRERPIPNVKGRIGKVIERCLAKQPEDRFETFAEILNELHEICQTETGKVVSVTSISKQDPNYLSRRGQQLAFLGCFEQALTRYDEALKLIPFNSDGAAMLLANKGSVLAAMGRHTDAISCYEQALKICSTEVAAAFSWIWLVNISRDLQALQRLQEALECINKALTSCGSLSIMVWIERGIILYKLGRCSEALSCLEEALKLDSRQSKAWNVKGLVLVELGSHDEALDCFEKVLRIDPGNCQAWDNKGLTFAMLGFFNEALSSYEKALDLDPKSASSWYGRGTVLIELGRFEEALDSLKRFVSSATPSMTGLVQEAQTLIRQLEQANRES